MWEMLNGWHFSSSPLGAEVVKLKHIEYQQLAAPAIANFSLKYQC